jgi:hypothetical protein
MMMVIRMTMMTRMTLARTTECCKRNGDSV